ncbi:cation:proton antiporter [Sphingobacterium sp. LRF_L2]|uniref:cation:proton antiporter n=1 Tax=Sphingobacterium sp. LRF_L2 TaxID=3369421 RepID=UPI003F634437
MNRKLRNGIFYFALLISFSILVFLIIQQGKTLEGEHSFPLPHPNASPWREFLTSISQNLEHPLAILLAQILVIILATRLFGWLCKKVGQPTVIGEITAGIILGPSFFGLHFPALSQVLFPIESLGNLEFLSQIGLIFFMFIIGMEVDLKTLKVKARDAIIISHASIIFPFSLGVGLAYFLYGTFAPKAINFTSFSLFIGISMSITAFPVLARIIQERTLQKSRLGRLVITSAAIDDVTAWCLLAIVVAFVKAGNSLAALYIICIAIVYVFLMIKFVRPFLQRIGEMYDSRENLNKPVVAIFFLILMASCYITEVIGIHALFGAFMAGAIMPDSSKFRSTFTEKVEDVSLILFLPIFFVYTGLRTQIGLLDEFNLWAITGVVVLVAITGKFIGSMLAAKFVGQSWKNSLTIGALMNTRGLIELVVLTIGYDLGMLSPEVFAMMVIMALTTTLMTSPTLDLIDKIFKPKGSLIPAALRRIGKFNILIAFGHPDRGRNLLRLAHGLTRKLSRSTSITAVHLTPTNDLHHYNADQFEKNSFHPILEEARLINQEIKPLFKAANNMESEVVEIANEGSYDLLLIGIGQSIFNGSTLGKIFGFTTRIINPEKIIYQVIGKENPLEHSIFSDSTQQILYRSKISVGVFIDKDFLKADRILLPIFTSHDLKLIRYVQRFIHNAGAQVTVLDNEKLINNSLATLEQIRAIEQVAPNHISRLEHTEIDLPLLQRQDLIILSTESCKQFFDSRNVWISNIPSVLIIKDRE